MAITMKTDYPLPLDAAMIEESSAVLINICYSMSSSTTERLIASMFMLCNGSPLEMIAQLLGAVSARKLDFDRKDLPKLSSRSLLRL